MVVGCLLGSPWEREAKTTSDILVLNYIRKVV